MTARRFIIVAVSLVVVGCLIFLFMPEGTDAMEGGTNGFQWQQFSESARWEVVDSYRLGYLFGYDAGCAYGAEHGQGAVSFHRCFDTRLKYSKDPTYYVQQITKYYEKYPKYRKVPFRLLLEEMSDQRNKSVDEMYQYFQRFDIPFGKPKQD